MKKFLSLFVALAMVLSLFAGVGARSAKAAITVVYASTAALANPAVSVDNGTLLADAKLALDPTVAVAGTHAEAGTADIAWTIAGYSATVAGDYTATGVLTLPDTWTGSPANVTATVTVDPVAVEYVSTSPLAHATVSVANGTTLANAKLALDPTVPVIGSGSEIGTADIAWTIAGYSATTAGNYDATGVLTLPDGWTGSPEDVTATVTVLPVAVTYASTAALANPAVSVDNGTLLADAKLALDPTVAVAGTHAEAGTADIAWTIAGYSATVAGDYTATGVLTLPDTWTGSPANVTATVTVDPVAVEYVSTSPLAHATVSVANGTTLANAKLALDPTVPVIGSGSEIGTADIAWTIAGYSATTAGNYDATGVLTLPDGWTGSPEDVTATVTVDPVPVAVTYASTAALATPTVTVANGTIKADAIAALDPTVTVVGTHAEIGAADIAWTIASYATTAGDYTATGVLTLPDGWTGSPANVTATVTVAPGAVVYASTAALAHATVSVANGTTLANAKLALDPTVAVAGTHAEAGTADIAWTIAGYSATTAGDYTATGVLTLPATWTGSPEDVTATVTVTLVGVIATRAIAGVTAPVIGATPVATIAATTEYTATISWNGSPATFAAATIYTATITLTPKTGFTLTGVTANFFTVAGATATNAANSGVVTAVFPATAPAATTKAITAFNFNGLTPAVIGVVNETAKTVALTVPYGTVVTALVPTITITGASVSPLTAVAHNFTSPVIYTVTAADATIANYIVTVTVAPAPIVTYTLTYTAGANGTITGTTPQTVNSGASGTLVTAVPNATYHFVSWSDGILTAARTDTNVLANIAVTATFALTTTIRGDIGGNGTVGMDDALLVARYVASLTTLTASQFLAADLNHDGFVNMTDALVIAQIYAGISH